MIILYVIYFPYTFVDVNLQFIPFRSLMITQVNIYFLLPLILDLCIFVRMWVCVKDVKNQYLSRVKIVNLFKRFILS